MIFNIVDCTNRIIYLTKERWKHISLEHKEAKVESIQEILKKPIKITQSNFDENVRWYYQFVKERRKYVLVAVKYVNGKGFVITAYYVRNMI